MITAGTGRTEFGEIVSSGQDEAQSQPKNQEDQEGSDFRLVLGLLIVFVLDLVDSL